MNLEYFRVRPCSLSGLLSTFRTPQEASKATEKAAGPSPSKGDRTDRWQKLSPTGRSQSPSPFGPGVDSRFYDSRDGPGKFATLRGVLELFSRRSWESRSSTAGARPIDSAVELQDRNLGAEGSATRLRSAMASIRSTPTLSGFDVQAYRSATVTQSRPFAFDW